MRADESLAETVDRPDEAHDELVRRVLVEVARLADLHDLALVHEDDAVGDLHGLFLVVRHEHGRDVDVVVEMSEPLPQLLPNACVERAERLVEEQHPGLDRERACKRHALALPTRELRRVPVGEPGELNEVEEGVNPLADLLLSPLADRQPECDVVEDGHVLERGVVLEHHSDAALLRREPGRVLAQDRDLAGVGLLEPGDHPEQRRLPAAARAEKRGQGPGRDRDRDVVERDEATEPLCRLLHRDRHGHAPFFRGGSLRGE